MSVPDRRVVIRARYLYTRYYYKIRLLGGAQSFCGGGSIITITRSCLFTYICNINRVVCDSV